MQISNFLALTAIIAFRSVLTPQISKTHLPIHLIYVNLNQSDAQKPIQGKWEPLLGGGGGVQTQLAPQYLKIY